MAKTTSLLFVCTGNSIRSQMAEGFAHHHSPNWITVDSAGILPAGLNPYAIWAMNEVGIDISKQSSDSLSGKDLSQYHYFVTLCQHSSNSCPILPTSIQVEHWDLPDPASIAGNAEAVMIGFRAVRYIIERKVLTLLKSLIAANQRLARNKLRR